MSNLEKWFLFCVFLNGADCGIVVCTDVDHLPLKICRKELDNYIKFNTKIKVINAPKNAVTVSVRDRGVEKFNSGMINGTKEMTLTKFDKVLLVTLWNGKNLICAEKEVILLIEDARCINKEPAQPVPEFIEVDFENRCGSDYIKEPPHAILGSKKSLGCVNNEGEHYKMQWRQIFDQGNITLGPVLVQNDSKLTLKLIDIDENTAIVCELHNGFNTKMATFYKIKQTPYKYSKKAIVYYGNNFEVDLSCESFGGDDTLLVALQGGAIRSTVNYTAPVKRQFKDKDNGTVIFCVHYVRTHINIVERFIDNEVQYIYKPMKNAPQLPPKPVIPSTPSILLHVNDDVEYKCKNPNPYTPGLQMLWQQKFLINDQQIKYTPLIEGAEYNLKLILQDFDNNTEFSCDVQNNRLHKYTVNLDSKQPNSKNPDETGTISKCNEFSSDYYIIQLQNNSIGFTPNEDDMKKVDISDKESKFYCMFFEKRKIDDTDSYQLIRHVIKINPRVYQEEKGPIASVEQQNDDINMYYFIGGGVIGILIIILIIIWCKRRMFHKVQQPSIKENNNGKKDEVTYAELELSPIKETSGEKRKTVEETPYAEIVMHNNKPYIHVQDKGESNDESPYAIVC